MTSSLQLLCFIFLLLRTLTTVEAAGDFPGRYTRLSSSSASRLANQSQAVISFLQQRYPRTAQGRPSLFEMFQITGVCGAAAVLWYLLRLKKSKKIEAIRQRTSAPGSGAPSDDISTRMFYG
jgi:hypothetical protein